MKKRRFTEAWFFNIFKEFDAGVFPFIRFFKLAANGLRLGEVGDFYHKCSYEAHTSNLRKTVIRSETATFAKPLLADALLSVRSAEGQVLQSVRAVGKINL